MNNYKFVIVGNNEKISFVEKLAGVNISDENKHRNSIEFTFIHYVNNEFVNIKLVNLGSEAYHLSSVCEDAQGVFVWMGEPAKNVGNVLKWKKELDNRMNTIKYPVVLLTDHEYFDYDCFCKNNGFHKYMTVEDALQYGISNMIDFLPSKNGSSLKTLSEVLYENTKINRKLRKQYVQEQYIHLQDHVVDLLKTYSLKNLGYSCEIEICELYIKDYYEDKKETEYTKLGERFMTKCFNLLPGLNELETLTTQLEKYLISQGFKVSYLSHCYLRICWYK